MKNKKGKLINFNINIEAKTAEEAFRNSPAEHENMLKSLYSIADIMTGRNVDPDEKKKAKHTRIGYTYGVVAVLGLMSVDRNSANVSTSAGIVNELINMAPDERALQRFAALTLGIVFEAEIGLTEKKMQHPIKDVQVKVVRSVDGKLEKSNMDDLPQHIKDEIMKVLGEQKDAK